MASGHDRQILVIDDLNFFHHRGAVPQQVAKLNALVSALKGAAINAGAVLKTKAGVVKLFDRPVAGLYATAQDPDDCAGIKGLFHTKPSNAALVGSGQSRSEALKTLLAGCAVSGCCQGLGCGLNRS